MVEKILNNTNPYGKIRASHEGSLHSSTLIAFFKMPVFAPKTFANLHSNCIIRTYTINRSLEGNM